MICILEDDTSLREVLVYTLKNTGFEVEGFSRGVELFKSLSKKTPDMILLDIMLPDEDGISVLKKLRDSRLWSEIPVIMLTAKSDEYDKVIALDFGADDYITKPFGMMELVSRIKAVLRRSKKDTENQILVHKDLVMDESAHLVKSKDNLVDLTIKEYQILKLLLINKNRVVSRDTLMQKVWGYDYFGDSRTVDVHISAIRTKLKSCSDYIITVRGIGYKIGETSDK